MHKNNQAEYKYQIMKELRTLHRVRIVWMFPFLDELFLCFLPCQEERTLFHSSIDKLN